MRALALLLPAAEVMRESVRTLPITRVEQAANWAKSWENLHSNFADRVPAGGGPQGLLSVMSIALAGAAIGMARGRRIQAFYFSTGALFLSLAPETPLFDLYRRLPVVGDLRNSFRFLWITSFSISVLVGFGLEALAADRGDRRRRPRLGLAGALLAVVGLHLLVPFGLAWWEWALAGGALAVAAGRPRIGFASTVCLLLLLGVCHFIQDWRPTLGFLANEAPLYESAPAFERIGELRTPQDRVYPLLEPADLESDLAMRAKTPSLHGLPSIVDYEHLTSRRYAELYVRMTTERPLRTAGQWIRGRRPGRSDHRAHAERGTQNSRRGDAGGLPVPLRSVLPGLDRHREPPTHAHPEGQPRLPPGAGAGRDLDRSVSLPTDELAAGSCNLAPWHRGRRGLGPPPHQKRPV
jgi:hypothetical protein